MLTKPRPPLSLNFYHWPQPQLLSDVLIILGLILVGAVIRWPLLQIGLWRDEGSTYFDAVPTTIEAVIQRVIFSELNPPGFYILMHYWLQWFGDSDVTLKLPALLFGILLIPTVYVLARSASSTSAGLIAATITAFAPRMVYYSQEARPYTLTAWLICLTVLLYWKMLVCPRDHKRQIFYLVSFSVCASLLLYVQYTGLLLVGSLLCSSLYFLIFQKTTRFYLLCAGFSLTFLSFIPWLPHFLLHLQTGTPWDDKLPLIGRLRRLFENIANTVPLVRSPSIWIACIILIALFIGILTWTRKSVRFNPLSSILQQDSPVSILIITIAFCILVPSLIMAALSYRVRYTTPYLPLAWILYGVGLSSIFLATKQLSNRSTRVGRQIIITALLILLVVPSAKEAFNLGKIDKSGIRLLGTAQKDTNWQQTFYVLNSDAIGPTFGYYFRHHPVNFGGFARWDNPEIFSPQGYVELWEDPLLLTIFETRIREVSKQGYQQLALVQQKGPFRDMGRLRTSQANFILEKLSQNYQLIEKKEFSGQMEPIELYVFKLPKAESGNA